jgi:hypothetical protein
MKRNIFITLAGLITAFIISSCSGTNNLAKYDLYQKNIYFDKTIASGANQEEIEYTYEAPKNKKNEGVFESIGNVAKGIGQAIIEGNTREKLMNASNPDSVVNYISHGIEKTLIQYMNINPVNDYRGQYDFIVNTTLEELKFVSNSGSMYIKVRAVCTITSRKNGSIVWENSESENIPLKRYSSNNSDSKFIKDLGQLTDLATLSENEIRLSIQQASQEVGRLMGVTLREDISEAKR